jgi:hypothetical protein
MSMISYGLLILITSSGLCGPGCADSAGCPKRRCGQDAAPPRSRKYCSIEVGSILAPFLRRDSRVSRIRWFLAGAAVTAGALAAAPSAYERLRSVLGPVTSPLLPAGSEEDDFDEADDLSAFDVRVDPEPFVPDPAADDTAELRNRIDETRARIHERAQSVREDEEPES